MKLLKLTLESAVANIALDEALLESAELNDGSSEVLRIWEPRVPAVVLGEALPLRKRSILSFAGQTVSKFFAAVVVVNQSSLARVA